MRTTEVGWVTSEESPNRTASRAAVYATDLGILWDDGDGGVLAAFGDSYGAGWSAPGAGPRHADWRCNVLAQTPREEPRDGLMLHEWVQDAPGHAAQVLPRGSRAREETVIPPAGIAHAEVQYLHAMSMRGWDGPGRWRTNHAALWSSHDCDRSWRPTGVRWSPRRGGARTGRGSRWGPSPATGRTCCCSAPRRGASAGAPRAVARPSVVVVLRRRRDGWTLPRPLGR